MTKRAEALRTQQPGLNDHLSLVQCSENGHVVVSLIKWHVVDPPIAQLVNLHKRHEDQILWSIPGVHRPHLLLDLTIVHPDVGTPVIFTKDPDLRATLAKPL